MVAAANCRRESNTTSMSISFLNTAYKNILKFHTGYYLKTFDATGLKDIFKYRPCCINVLKYLDVKLEIISLSVWE